MPPLRVATYLGDNTLPILDALARQLSPDIDLLVDRGDRSSEAAERHADRFDLVWICGHLGQRLLATGAIRGRIVAAPVFAGETEAVYRTVLIARRDRGEVGRSTSVPAPDRLLDGRLAINERASWSGHLALRRHVADRRPGRWFADEVLTGSHRASIDAVRAGDCDVAGIDSSIWAHAAAGEPDLLADLRVVAETRSWPAPPLVVHDRVRSRLSGALVAAVLAFDATGVAGLERFVAAGPDDYVDL